MPIYVPGKLVLRQTYIGTDDPDAEAYIAAVEAADEAASPGIGPLEIATKVAIHSFVKGCKADGIWPAIKASCILAGARTLNGALVPLVGTAPTSFNFVAGDYNRKTGLVGDGSTKYLNSGRFGNSDPQNSKHISVYVTDPLGSTGTFIGGRTIPETIVDQLGLTSVSSMIARVNSAGFQTVAISYSQGFYGLNRSNSAAVNWRAASSLAGSVSTTSGESPNFPIDVFRRSGSTNNDPTTARFAFYSIGESLDLALLDARVTALINAFAAVIP
jgi:hypothetical protein